MAVWLTSVSDDMHAPLVKQFAKQGYHILCEKPMATSIADCVEMVKDVEENPDKIFGIGHGRSSLWSPLVISVHGYLQLYLFSS